MCQGNQFVKSFLNDISSKTQISNNSFHIHLTILQHNYLKVIISHSDIQTLGERRPPPSMYPDDPESDPDHSPNLITCPI